MAISFIGFSSAPTSSVILPDYDAGDLIVIFAYNSSSTSAPSLAAGYTTYLTKTTGAGLRIGTRVAATSGTGVSSGTWTGATAVSSVVYRGTPGLGDRVFWNGLFLSGTTLTYSALSLAESTWVMGYGELASATQNVENPPTGMVNRLSQVSGSREYAVHDTSSNIASWSSRNVTVSSTAILGRYTYVIEILPGDVTVQLTGTNLRSITSIGTVTVSTTSSVTVSLSGVQAAGQIGSVEITLPSITVFVTGVAAQGQVGAAQFVLQQNVTGVSAFGVTGQVNFWADINDSQDSSWVTINQLQP